jgi:hypothetical protein
MVVIKSKILFLCALVMVATGLVSCAEEEQNRVLRYEKGTYLGKPDQSLSSDQVRRLIMRSHVQRVD